MNKETLQDVNGQFMEPFKHNCKKCEWVTWLKIGRDNTANMYLCGGKTIVIRFSSESCDYVSYTVGGEKKEARWIKQSIVDAVKKRENEFK